MRLPALLATLALAGCGRSSGVPDEELGNLVLAPAQQVAPIAVDRAAKDPAELTRALARPYRDLVAALGPHTYVLDTETGVDEAGAQVSQLSDHVELEHGEGGAYHAVYTNSADYGREVIYVERTLYLRSRYQRWHARAPETPDEPVALRDSLFEAIAATWDLVAPGAELTDGGATTVAGRAGRKVTIGLAESPRKPAPEKLVQRAWRDKRAIKKLSGEIVLDRESGLPLAARLDSVVEFTRDGRPFEMVVELDARVATIGSPVAIGKPTPAAVVATPERVREVDDHDFLLQGIAPPSRRNPDGTPVLPAPRFAGSGAPPEDRPDAPPRKADGDE